VNGFAISVRFPSNNSINSAFLGVVCTANNSGHTTGEFYFSDESRLGIDYKQLYEFVQPLNGLVDAAVLAR
jgi:hypothetical protein